MEHLKKLTNLGLSCNQITDISVLEHLKKLTSLWASRSQITDISALKGLKNLIDLDLSKNQITDISALKGLKEIKFLVMNNNIITDISGLKNLKNLVYLEMNNNKIADISALKDLNEIKFLKMNNNKITDISALKNLVNFEISNNNISDISVLKNLNEIKYLEINNNKITEYHEKIGNAILREYNFKGNPINIKIDKIKIEDFISIKKIELDNLANKNFIFFLGENGSGKTVLLKAILLALKKTDIEKQSKTDTGKILDILDKNKNFKSDIRIKNNINPQKYKLEIKNLYAYGINRNKISETSKGESFGFMTLFSDDEFMTNTEEWLKNVERKELKKIKIISLEQIEIILKELLELENLRMFIYDDYSYTIVTFEVNNIEYSLDELSDGYRSVIIFIIDLIARITANNPDWTNTKQFRAIVLVDELDLFLHPTWTRKICNKLKTLFPNIQFFITTHSPILLHGAPKEETVIFRMHNKNNQTVISRRYEGREIEDWLPNILISSPLFDTGFLDDMPEDVFLRTRTEDNYPKMIKTDKNIEKLKQQEEEFKNQYIKDISSKK